MPGLPNTGAPDSPVAWNLVWPMVRRPETVVPSSAGSEIIGKLLDRFPALRIGEREAA
mgnify:CR=1 FL=1